MQAPLGVFDKLEHRDARAIFLSRSQQLAIIAKRELLARLEQVFASAANHFTVAGVLLPKHEHWCLSNGLGAELFVMKTN